MSEDRGRFADWFRSPLLPIFAIIFIAYGYFYQAGGWNQNCRFDLVRAGVEERSLRIDTYHRNTGDKACRGPKGRCVKAGAADHYYCDKAPGASWLAIPSYAIAYSVAGSESPSDRFLAISSHIATVTAVGLPSALSGLAMFWLVGLLGVSRRGSLGLALGYGLATLALPYSTLLYGHQLAAALLLIGFAPLVHERMTKIPMSALALLGVGMALGGSVIVEYPSAVPVFFIGVYCASWLRPWKRFLWLGVGGAIPGLVCAAYHWAAFGGPFTLPYEFSTQPHRSQGFFMGLSVPDLEVLLELFLGRFRGLFYSAPWLLLAIPGAYFLSRRSQFRRECGLCVAVVVFSFWLNSSLVDWHGGWAMGPRYLIVAIPFLVILAAGCFAPSNRVGRGLATVVCLALALYSARLMYTGTAVRPEIPPSIERPYSEYLGTYFDFDYVAINTQGIDMLVTKRNGVPQAYNLGQVWFGLRGRKSLIPLVLAQLFLLMWAWRRTRPSFDSTEQRHSKSPISD